ncbi:hypothetical protein SAMN05216553_109273 [Lentzea fradiae]|uniref:Uncharacterized protein n=1 Tax=Lentzea fradiae TaxID=200378 RepID=A0A1G7VK57_9PSEU|nr:hypothetical protein [Lentzea fradiae]SDG59941.1 hypothetical protein SAMN05216553_109273 [Lentzea fradiae]
MRCKLVGFVLLLIAAAGVPATSASAAPSDHSRPVFTTQDPGGGEGPNS